MDDVKMDQRSSTTGTAGQAEGADTIRDQAGSTMSPTEVPAAAATDHVSKQAMSLVGQAKDKALAAASEQKDGLADRVDELAQAVHKSGEQFAGRQDWIAGAIERGAAELGALAKSLRQNDVGDLFSQARSIAQRQPALFIGASLAAGFAIARLGKIVAADASRDDLPTVPEVGHGGR